MPFSTPRPLAILLALPLALGLAACGDDDDDAGSTTTTTTTAPGASSTTATTATADSSTTTTAPEPANLIAIEVVGGEPVGGAAQASVPAGEEVTIRVTADVEDEVHVHGYDLFVDVAPGVPGEVTFVADIPGQFEVELEGGHTLILELTVS